MVPKMPDFGALKRAMRGERELKFAGETVKPTDVVLDKIAAMATTVKRGQMRPLAKPRKAKPEDSGQVEEEAKDASWWTGKGKTEVVAAETFEPSDSEVSVEVQSVASNNSWEDHAHEPVKPPEPKSPVEDKAKVAKKAAEAWNDSDEDPWAESDGEKPKGGGKPAPAKPAPATAATGKAPAAGNAPAVGATKSQAAEKPADKPAPAKPPAVGATKSQAAERGGKAAAAAPTPAPAPAPPAGKADDPWADSDDEKPARPSRTSSKSGQSRPTGQPSAGAGGRQPSGSGAAAQPQSTGSGKGPAKQSKQPTASPTAPSAAKAHDPWADSSEDEAPTPARAPVKGKKGSGASGSISKSHASTGTPPSAKPAKTPKDKEVGKTLTQAPASTKEAGSGHHKSSKPHHSSHSHSRRKEGKEPRKVDSSGSPNVMF